MKSVSENVKNGQMNSNNLHQFRRGKKDLF